MASGKFYLVWDISKANDLNKNNLCTKQRISVSEMINFVDKSNFEFEGKSRTKDKYPIITAYLPFNCFIVLDGNHRKILFRG